MSRPDVLVVSHEASRTGAPKMVQLTLRALRRRQLVAHVVHRWGGELRAEIDAAASTSSSEPLSRTRATLRARGFRRAAGAVERLGAQLELRRRRPRVVWANTVLSGSWARPAAALGIPVVLHVHELEPTASQGLRRYGLDNTDAPVRLVACSEAVRDNLARITGRPVGDITVLPSLVDQDEVRRVAAAPHRGAGLTIVSCGTGDHRKGFDLWQQVVRLVRERGVEVTFRWVGQAAADSLDGAELVGRRPDAPAWIAGGDVFLLTSREDPFPLVVLEAMTLARPVVAFDVGGVGEQLGEAGVLVPPEDVGAMADALVALLVDDERRAALGAAAAERARSRFGFERYEAEVAAIVAAALNDGG